jgi:hypothetical protein
MERRELIAEIVRHETTPASWSVEAIDTAGDGNVERVTFSGPAAEGRAIEYAEAKYLDYRVLRRART